MTDALKHPKESAWLAFLPALPKATRRATAMMETAALIARPSSSGPAGMPILVTAFTMSVANASIRSWTGRYWGKQWM
jgi:hypothetical protein